VQGQGVHGDGHRDDHHPVHKVDAEGSTGEGCAGPGYPHPGSDPHIRDSFQPSLFPRLDPGRKQDDVHGKEAELEVMKGPADGKETDQLEALRIQCRRFGAHPSRILQDTRGTLPIHRPPDGRTPPLSLKKILIEENREATVISYTSNNEFFKEKIESLTVTRFLLELT
jgi:hypothetical protein